MEETKVSFETACLAKEKGFDEICHYHFGNDGHPFESRNPLGSKNSQWVKCTARPTLSFLQKWLREVYNIDVDVSRDVEIHYKDETRWIVKVSDWNDIQVLKTSIAELKHPNHAHYVDYKSFEQALEIGLQKGMLLIN